MKEVWEVDSRSIPRSIPRLPVTHGIHPTDLAFMMSLDTEQLTVDNQQPDHDGRLDQLTSRMTLVGVSEPPAPSPMTGSTVVATRCGYATPAAHTLANQGTAQR